MRPRWLLHDVTALLAGLDYSDRSETVQDETGKLYNIGSVEFTCGCIASDETGWTACGKGLHAVLAASEPNSRAAQSVRMLRPAFDAVLAEAWRRYGTHPEHFAEFYRNQEILSFEEWQRTHDLAQRPIWQNGDLRADLRKRPWASRVVLFSTGHSRDVIVRLLWWHGGVEKAELPSSPVEAVEKVFHGENGASEEAPS